MNLRQWIDNEYELWERSLAQVIDLGQANYQLNKAGSSALGICHTLEPNTSLIQKCGEIGQALGVFGSRMKPNMDRINQLRASQPTLDSVDLNNMSKEDKEYALSKFGDLLYFQSKIENMKNIVNYRTDGFNLVDIPPIDYYIQNPLNTLQNPPNSVNFYKQPEYITWQRSSRFNEEWKWFKELLTRKRHNDLVLFRDKIEKTEPKSNFLISNYTQKTTDSVIPSVNIKGLALVGVLLSIGG